MGKVYAVNTGCYSDYRIVAIFSTVKLAKEFQQTFHNDDYNDIEEYEIDPRDVENIKAGYSLWTVYMLINGDVENIEKMDANSYNVTGHYIAKRNTFPACIRPDALVSTVWARTEEQAIKIVNEHRVQMIANGEWI